MNKPIPLPFALFFSVWPALCGEPVAADEGVAPEKLSDWMIVAPGEPSHQKAISAFNGSPLQLRWIIRDTGEGPFRALADTFQILTTTLAPIDSKVELGADLKTQPGHPVEVIQKITLPASDKPLRLLVKLWLERGGNSRVLSTVIVRGSPADLLKSLSGETVTISGFETEPAWVAAFKKAGISVKKIPTPGENSIKSAWNGALIAKWPKGRPIPGGDSMADGQRLLALTLPDPGAEPEAEIFSHIGDGLVLTLPIGSTQNFANDPDIQTRMVRFLTTKPPHP